jgi:hypothetical protein
VKILWNKSAYAGFTGSVDKCEEMGSSQKEQLIQPWL